MKPALLSALLLSTSGVASFAPPSSSSTRLESARFAAPKRLDDNVDGVLYVNDRCIDCSACSHFAPTVFEGTGRGHHVVHSQPQTNEDVENARAALAACPVTAIRVETAAHRHHRGEEAPSEEEQELAKNLALSPKFNGRSLPFPRPLKDNVWYLGHHNEKSFGATPYLIKLGDDDDTWVMVDTPKCSKSAIDAVTGLTGPDGPAYLLLTHVDDTADHGKWREHFPKLKRIFHSGDLGRHNWIGDKTLETVEILLTEKSTPDELQAFTLDGTPLAPEDVLSHDAVIYHTPGHSPGSISMLHDNVLYTGDTLGYTTRTNSLTGFPNYGNDQALQAKILGKLESLDNWNLVAPGHGHVRDYRDNENLSKEMNEAKAELVSHRRRW